MSGEHLAGILQGFAIAIPIYLWLDRSAIPWAMDHLRLIHVHHSGT